MLSRFIILILMIGFVSGLDANLHCPDKIFEGKEFKCDIEISDGNGIYDLKIMADGKRNSVLKIFDGERWKSGYYYIKDFVRDGRSVKLKIIKVGRYDIAVKLRQGGMIERFDVGKLKVLVNTKNETIGEESNTRSLEVSASSIINKNDIISLNGKAQSIFLNKKKVTGSEEWDYISKDGRVVDMLPYGFCLFLIGFIAILIWEKRY